MCTLVHIVKISQTLHLYTYSHQVFSHTYVYHSGLHTGFGAGVRGGGGRGQIELPETLGGGGGGNTIRECIGVQRLGGRYYTYVTMLCTLQGG